MVLSPFLFLTSPNINMLVQPLKYGATTILTSNFSMNWRRIYICLRSFLLYRKWTMILIYYLFRRDLYYQRDYVFKTILNSEGTLNRKGTMVLRTLLISKGQKKKEMNRRKTRQHKSRKGEERKSSRQLNETLWCVFWIEWSPLFI